MHSVNFNEVDESNHFPALIQAIMQHFDFKKWGFNYEIIHAKHAIDFSSKITFQSELCKVQFRIFRDIRDSEAQFYSLYGRLHAPNDESITTWNGEKCHCWHLTQNVLNFLDGLTPQEAAKNRLAPTFMYDFYKENKHRGWSPLEMEVRRHAAIWDHYGLNLFNLFDSQHPDLWQKYSVHNKQLYDLTVTWPDHSITPSYKIC